MRIIGAKENPVTFKVAVVASRFNVEVTARLVEGALARLKERGFEENLITLAWVPGAIEIPLTALELARSGTVEAVICLGAVIRGETSHYDYVCDQVSQGCQTVALQTRIPVIFGVLTTEDDKQALDRAGGEHGNKGAEAVDTAVQMVNVIREIKN